MHTVRQRTALVTMLLAHVLVLGTPAHAAESTTKPSAAAEKCMVEAAVRKLTGDALQTFIMHCISGTSGATSGSGGSNGGSQTRP